MKDWNDPQLSDGDMPQPKNKLKQVKIPVVLEDNILKVAVDQGVVDGEKNWKLVRERDGLTCTSARITWLEWNETGHYKARHDEPAEGRSLLMSPFNQFFTWQTTGVTRIVEQREDYIKFETKNSNYELFKLANETAKED
jgi:hypothetical protein